MSSCRATNAKALNFVRRFGGVLEHPAYSAAFTAFGLAKPIGATWQRCTDGGFVAVVDQGAYGHVAKKRTWLYAFGARELPTLKKLLGPDQRSVASVSWCGNRTARFGARPRVGKSSLQTPAEFRDLLLAIARSVAL